MVVAAPLEANQKFGESQLHTNGLKIEFQDQNKNKSLHTLVVC